MLKSARARGLSNATMIGSPAGSTWIARDSDGLFYQWMPREGVWLLLVLRRKRGRDRAAARLAKQAKQPSVAAAPPLAPYAGHPLTAGVEA